MIQVEKEHTSSTIIQAKTRGLVGLANLGNSCFMNASIQAFRHCPEWTLFCKKKDDLLPYIQNQESSHAKILLAYQDLLQSIWAGSGPAYVRPNGFYDQLKVIVKGTLYEDFTRRTPQDAHEFLVWLLDQMYMATQKEVVIQVPSSPLLAPMVVQAVQGWKAAFEKTYSPLTDLIFGMLRIQYTCGGCKAVHTRWETFNVLKIQLAKDGQGKPLSFQACIEQEYKDDSIEGYHCDRCKETTHTATKRTTLWRLPKVLLVSLARFTPIGTRDNTPLLYDGSPLVLDSLFSQESTESSKTKEYNLFATIDHHGHHMGGHYTAQCFSPVWKQWNMYDDESVYDLMAPRFGVESYILMFR